MILDHNQAILKYAVKVGLYITDMSEFASLNALYKQYFGLKPPVRVCV